MVFKVGITQTCSHCECCNKYDSSGLHQIVIWDWEDSTTGNKHIVFNARICRVCYNILLLSETYLPYPSGTIYNLPNKIKDTMINFIGKTNLMEVSSNDN